MNTIAKNNFRTRSFVPRTYSDLIDTFFKDTFAETGLSKFIPGTDIAEDEKAYYLQIVLPGVPKEDIKIDLNEGVLSIAGERKLNREENGKKYHAIESHYGTFKRSFQLPENANVEAIEAEYINGILNVTIPKQEGKTLKSTIQIK